MSCPICGKPSQKAQRPFCSKRCADIDLGRWLNEDYALPSNDLEDLPETPTHDAPPGPSRRN